MYRSPHVRWVARRPPETFPPPRPAPLPDARPIPRYTYLPAWGLYDRPAVNEDSSDPARGRGGALVATLRATAIALAVTAGAHLVRYVLLAINRSTPIASWLDTLSIVLVWAAGVIALGFFAAAAVAVVGWLRHARAHAYRRHHRLDPRKPWQIAVYAAVPLVNLVGAPVLFRELITQRDDIDQARAGEVARRTAAAWVVVNIAAVAALCTRFVASRSESLQTGADGLWLTIISALLSAGFVWWALPRLIGALDGERRETAPDRRWVQVGQQ